MSEKIKVAAVSYLNTKPLLWGLENSEIKDEIELVTDYPSSLAKLMQEGRADVALLPVAAMKGIENARIVSDYGIGADGNVASVALFSRVPVKDIASVFLDYQSRTSVKLAEILLRDYWKQVVELLPAHKHYIDEISGTKAGVIIGDRALMNLNSFEYVYDLSAAWKDHMGLDFIFAAWISGKELPADFVARFNAANALGLNHLDEVIAANQCGYYDLRTYYTNNIKFHLDAQKRQGLDKFLGLIG